MLIAEIIEKKEKEQEKLCRSYTCLTLSSIHIQELEKSQNFNFFHIKEALLLLSLRSPRQKIRSDP